MAMLEANTTNVKYSATKYMSCIKSIIVMVNHTDY